MNIFELNFKNNWFIKLIICSIYYFFLIFNKQNNIILMQFEKVIILF